MNQKQYDLAYLQGTTARQNSRPQKDNPYANKPTLRPMRDRWNDGWNEAHAKIKGEPA